MVIGWLESIDKVKSIYNGAIVPFINRRAKELQTIIESELRQGDFSRVHDDDKISIMYRLMNDINEGVGKNNIRLLAKTIVGLNNKEQLTASRFHYFNTIIAPLSHGEIIFLAEIVKAYNNPIAVVVDGQNREFLGYAKIDPRNIFSVAQAVKMTSGSHVLQSLLKTGFFQPCNPKLLVMNAGYKISPSFIEFMDLINNWEEIAKWSEG